MASLRNRWLILKKYLALLTVIGAGLFVSPAFAADPLFAEGDHCVAYRAKKKIFLIHSDDVVGRNCDVSALMVPDLGKVSYLRLVIPIESFSSGDVERDREVAKLLKVNQGSQMVFESMKLPDSEWQGLFLKPEVEVEGTLEIGGQKFPVRRTKVKVIKGREGWEVYGRISATYEEFGLLTPKKGGGFIAQADKNLELHFHLLTARTVGAQNLLNGVAQAPGRDQQRKTQSQ